MNDTEINGIAQGIMLYLMQQCKEPMDALGVILCLTLHFYDKGVIDTTIEEYAGQLEKDIIAQWRYKHPETLQ